MTREEAIKKIIEKRLEILEEAARQGYMTEYRRGAQDTYWQVLEMLSDPLESLLIEIEPIF